MRLWILVLTAAVGLLVVGCAEEPPTATPTPGLRLTRAQVIETVLARWDTPAIEALVRENPSLAVVRLMTLGDYETHFSPLRGSHWLTDQQRDRAALVWVIQVKLTSDYGLKGPIAEVSLPTSGRLSGLTFFRPILPTPVPGKPIYAITVLDDLRGLISRDTRGYEPVFSQ